MLTKTIAAYVDEDGNFVPEQVVALSADEAAEYEARQTAWSDGTVRRDALAAIAELEATITPRRLRDAVLTDDGRAWLDGIESQIAMERAKL